MEIGTLEKSNVNRKSIRNCIKLTESRGFSAISLIIRVSVDVSAHHFEEKAVKRRLRKCFYVSINIYYTMHYFLKIPLKEATYKMYRFY